MNWRIALSIYRNLLFFCLVFIMPVLAFGQDDVGNGLDAKYQELLRKSETYENYRVISTEKLNALWRETTDSLAKYRNGILVAELRVQKAEFEAVQANDSVAAVHEKLEASESINGSISFLGLSVNKKVYNIVVWSIVGVLLVALGALYLLFKRNDELTMRAKRDLTKVSEELEELRQRSNEKQAKLKRELQTALNQMEENRRKVSVGK